MQFNGIFGQFWGKIKTQLVNQRIPKPDVTIANVNIVEGGCKHNNTLVTKKLQELRNYLGLIDSWRTISPNFKAYSISKMPKMLGVG